MAKGKYFRTRVIMECINCVQKGANKESTGVCRYSYSKESQQYTRAIRIQKKSCHYCCKHTIHHKINK